MVEHDSQTPQERTCIGCGRLFYSQKDGQYCSHPECQLVAKGIQQSLKPKGYRKKMRYRHTCLKCGHVWDGYKEVVRQCVACKRMDWWLPKIERVAADYSGAPPPGILIMPDQQPIPVKQPIQVRAESPSPEIPLHNIAKVIEEAFDVQVPPTPAPPASSSEDILPPEEALRLIDDLLLTEDVSEEIGEGDYQKR